MIAMNTLEQIPSKTANRVTLMTDDVQILSGFYIGKFGAKMIRDQDCRALLRLGSGDGRVFLEILDRDEYMADPFDDEEQDILVPVADVAKVHGHLCLLDPENTGKLMDADPGQYFSTKDPDGNNLIVASPSADPDIIALETLMI